MMRDLAISYGNSRQAKNWVNKTISFDALKERLKTTIRTTESAEEYAKMSKAQRDAAKDHGGFVGGTLKGGRRKIDTVELRSMIALDGDRIDKAFLDNYETIAPYTSVLYTTHSSTEDSPRVRIIFPMTRDVSSEEFVAVSRYVAQALGIDFFIRTDPAGNIKPDKEKSTEKIDGAVATIMALDRAIRCGNDTAESVYDSRGLLFI